MAEKLDISRLDTDNLQDKLLFMKELVTFSMKEPQQLYPHFDKIAVLLESDKKVLVWNSLKIIGNLALVDKDNKIDELLSDIISMLNKGNLITAKNAIESLGKIAFAKRDLTELIVVNLLQVENYKYETEESTNIAVGKAITVLTKLYPITEKKAAIKALAEKHLKNERPATLANAEELFKKLDQQKN